MKEKILKILCESARTSNAQIATMLGVTEEEVAAAIAEMEADGIINGYTAAVNWEKLENNYVSAMIELRVTPQHNFGFDEIAQRIMEFEEVKSVYLMSGGFDLLVELRGTSFQEIALFVAKRLSPMESVVSTATHFLLTRYKEDGISFVNGEEDRRSMVL